MKTKSARPAKTAPTDAFAARLAAYSALAAAGSLMAPAVATATIVNITVDSFTITGGSHVVPTLSGPASQTSSVGFAVGPAQSMSLWKHNLNVSIWPGSANAVIEHGAAGTGSAKQADKLAKGAALNGARFYAKGGYLAYGGNIGSFVPANNAAATGYIGFKAKSNSQTYYGWLRAQVTADGSGNISKVTFVDKAGDGIYGAYGLAGDNITAGATAAVPEPANVAMGLGLLALGAVGVREMRRRRQLAA